MSNPWEKLVAHAEEIKRLISVMLKSEMIVIGYHDQSGEVYELEYRKKEEPTLSARFFTDKMRIYSEWAAEDFNEEQRDILNKQIGEMIGIPNFGRHPAKPHFDAGTFSERGSAIYALYLFYKDFEFVKEVSDKFLKNWIQKVKIYEDVDLKNFKIELISFAKRIQKLEEEVERK